MLPTSTRFNVGSTRLEFTQVNSGRFFYALSQCYNLVTMSVWPKFEEKELPPPPRLVKAVGVGIVVMGMAMGTGELIIWPHLVASYGLKILWFALVGITIQYFINQEVARHTLATGESFFTASARVINISSLFWIVAAVLLYVWPAWATALGTILSKLTGFGGYEMWAWISLALVLVITFSGRIAYEVLEKSLKVTVPAFFFLLVAISFYNLSPALIKEALSGLFSFGYIPENVDWHKLLGAIVFAGAGGMLNLCVSLWYRDKQAGMGHYVGRITNPVSGRAEAVAVTGFKFAETKENLSRWKGWMRYIRVDQGLIFWLLGIVTLFLLAVNAYAVLAPQGIIPEGLDVAVAQAQIFGSQWGKIGETIYLVMAYLMLFSVMWTVLDALTRIATDIIHTNSRVGKLQTLFAWGSRVSVHHLYYGLITAFVFMSALLVPFKQPLSFLIISSVLGGLSMAIYMPILIYLNNAKLPKALRPGWFTNLIMLSSTGFYWFFAYRVLIEQFG